MRHRRRPKSKVHDRTPNAPGRRRIGPKSARPGYPALFFGQGAATKTLAEIAAREPIGIEDLPERDIVTPQNIGFTVRRLTAIGLVGRFHRAEQQKRFDLTLDRRHPLAGPVAAVLRSIATVADVALDGDMHRLMDPIEQDGLLVVSEMVGSIRLYSFARGPWVAPLQALVEAMLVEYPKFRSRVEVARTLMLHGGFSNRIHLRRYLGVE